MSTTNEDPPKLVEDELVADTTDPTDIDVDMAEPTEW